MILARLVEISAAVPGILSVKRNALDVSFIDRPAVIVQDGSEENPVSPRSENRSSVQTIDLSPQLWLFVRGEADDAGRLMNLFRGRLITAIAGDATLREATGEYGAIRYEGCTVSEPTPETKEPRMDLNFTFTYVLQMSDLTET